MNNQYWISYSNSLERVLSVGHVFKYSSRAVERAISYSKFFQNIEKDTMVLVPTIDDEELVKQIYPELEVDTSKINEFVETSWAAYSYMYLQGETRLTFECIFLYIGIDKMFSYFPLYHEMDFSHLLDEFTRLYHEKSVLAILCERYGLSLKEISTMTNISYSTLVSLSQRKRDIRKLNAKDAVSLASFLRVRIETLCELEIN